MTAKGAVNKTEMLLRSYHMTRKLYEGYTRPRVKWKRVSRHKFSPERIQEVLLKEKCRIWVTAPIKSKNRKRNVLMFSWRFIKSTKSPTSGVFQLWISISLPIRNSPPHRNVGESGKHFLISTKAKHWDFPSLLTRRERDEGEEMNGNERRRRSRSRLAWNPF